MCCEVFPPGTPDYEAMASLGRMVAQCGPGIEDVVRQRKTQDPNLWYAGTPRYQIKSIIIIPHAFVISVSFLLVFVRSRDDWRKQSVLVRKDLVLLSLRRMRGATD